MIEGYKCVSVQTLLLTCLRGNLRDREKKRETTEMQGFDWKVIRVLKNTIGVPLITVVKSSAAQLVRVYNKSGTRVSSSTTEAVCVCVWQNYVEIIWVCLVKYITCRTRLFQSAHTRVT